MKIFMQIMSLVIALACLPFMVIRILWTFAGFFEEDFLLYMNKYISSHRKPGDKQGVA